MKETTTTDIYNYLTEFQCDLNVCVTNNNNDIIEEGIAKKTSAMNGFYIGNYTNIYLSGQTYKGLTFNAEYQRSPTKKEMQKQEDIVKYFT